MMFFQKSKAQHILVAFVLVGGLLNISVPVSAFSKFGSVVTNPFAVATNIMKMNSNVNCADSGHPSMLPGDPSLLLVTNVDLGDKKLEVMKACSKAIEAATGKPEQWIAVSIRDKEDIIFGGTDAPAALGCVYSLGSISMESNGAMMKSFAEHLGPFGVPADRMYVNFFDMPRANVGWNGKTFAG